jgi:hypothetical protein
MTPFAAASESTQNRYIRRGLSSNRHATLLDCSRCNRWHSTSHRGQTHGDRNVHLSLRECDNQRHQNLPYLRSTLSIIAAVVSGGVISAELANLLILHVAANNPQGNHPSTEQRNCRAAVRHLAPRDKFPYRRETVGLAKLSAGLGFPDTVTCVSPLITWKNSRLPPCVHRNVPQEKSPT